VQRQVENEKEEEEGETAQTKLEAGSVSSLQIQEEEEEEDKDIQTKESAGCTSEQSIDIESRIRTMKGGGRPLPASVRAFYEPRFGYNFSRVQVHADTKAADAAKSINAKAFTMGKDVVFGGGEYSPETTAGKRLLAHELTHVVQQNSDQKEQ